MKIAIILLSCAQTERRTTLTADWFRMLARQLQQYFFEQSGGRLVCQFTVYEWMVLSLTGQEWSDAGPAVGDAARAEAAAHHNFKEVDFNHFFLVIDEQVGSLGATDYKTDTRIAAVSATPTIFAHELAHALRVGHTQLETPDGPQEYGGPFCIMGFEGGKYSFFPSELADTAMGADVAHSASGPGMCVASLAQANWLDVNVFCHRVIPYNNGSLGTTLRIGALNGAPASGSATRVGCLIEIYDRFIVEYRHPDTHWDSGLAARAPSTDGWLVVYRSPVEGPLNALQVSTLAVKPGAVLVIDDHPFYIFGASALRLYVMAIDRQARTVDIRVERQKGKADQYFPTEGLLDYLQWPIQLQAIGQPDEPVDQIASSLAKLRDLRRLERLSDPRTADAMHGAVQEQVRELRQMVDRFEI